MPDSALVIPDTYLCSNAGDENVPKYVQAAGVVWEHEHSYKYLKIQDKIVTSKEMDEFRKFADEKAKSMLIIRKT